MDSDSKSIPCTWADESNCGDCDLKEKLNCRHSRELVACFRKRHLGYAATAFLVTGMASWFTGFWILFLAYAAITALNLAFVETYILCRHCPFYAKEGRTLKCITLEGLPRIWRYSPAPISRHERIAMMIIGGFVDLFPLLAGGYAVWVLFNIGADMVLLVLMAVATMVMGGLTAYMGKFIGDEYCAKCVNFSCVMNKAPKSFVSDYLERNPEMRDAWEKAGYDLGKS